MSLSNVGARCLTWLRAWWLSWSRKINRKCKHYPRNKIFCFYKIYVLAYLPGPHVCSEPGCHSALYQPPVIPAPAAPHYWLSPASAAATLRCSLAPPRHNQPQLRRRAVSPDVARTTLFPLHRFFTLIAVLVHPKLRYSWSGTTKTWFTKFFCNLLLNGKKTRRLSISQAQLDWFKIYFKLI